MLPVILAIRDEKERNYVDVEYEKYRKRLYLLAYDVVKNVPDAEDCVQETVIILIDHLQGYQGWDEVHQICFLKRCCKNIAIGKYRRNKVRWEKEVSMYNEEGELYKDVGDDDISALDMIISKENHRRLVELLETLDPIYSDVLYFHYFAQMSKEEIAKMCGITVGAVTVRIHRARKMLIEKKGDEIHEIRRK